MLGDINLFIGNLVGNKMVSIRNLEEIAQSLILSFFIITGISALEKYLPTNTPNLKIHTTQDILDPNMNVVEVFNRDYEEVQVYRDINHNGKFDHREIKTIAGHTIVEKRKHDMFGFYKTVSFFRASDGRCRSDDYVEGIGWFMGYNSL